MMQEPPSCCCRSLSEACTSVDAAKLVTPVTRQMVNRLDIFRNQYHMDMVVTQKRIQKPSTRAMDPAYAENMFRFLTRIRCPALYNYRRDFCPDRSA